MDKKFKVSTEIPKLPDIDQYQGSLNLFDQKNPDILLFNLVDDELIRLGGSVLLFYKYYGTEEFDPVYMESRNKPISKIPIIVHGHYDPVSLSEDLTEFGLELTNDQQFTFNKSYIENKLGRPVIPGDIIQPKFQNQKYEIYQAVEDSFELYGVYHIVCSARLLRDSEVTLDNTQTNKLDDIGGYGGL